MTDRVIIMIETRILMVSKRVSMGFVGFYVSLPEVSGIYYYRFGIGIYSSNFLFAIREFAVSSSWSNNE